MNPHIVCLFIALSSDPAPHELPTVYSPSPVFVAAVRGQNQTYDENPAANGQNGNALPPTYTLPPPSAPGGTLAPNQQYYQDPFLGQPGGMMQNGPGYAMGANGPQPYRFGWATNGDVAILPSESTSGGRGDFEVFEANVEFKYTQPIMPGWIGSVAHQYGLRNWDGPGAPGLPGNVHRFGLDFVLATPANQHWSVQLGFNPSLNTDFNNSLSSDAWNFDGRGIFFLRYSPELTLALGAGFLDRVKDQVIPYAGLIWTPDDRTEWRIMFPKSQLSYFLGNGWGVAQWIYVAGEYHIEAYEIQEALSGRSEKVQLEDYRIMVGLRTNSGGVTSFLEGGWVFGRNVDFLHGTQGFNIGSGFIARLGVRY